MPHGWIILDKPAGLGSTQAVGAVKRAFRDGGFGKAKVGHGGTLDPLASGVLPIAVGEATKVAGRMLDSDKAYDFEITFGTQTDTLDREGRVMAESAARPSLAAIELVLARFTGAIEQRPPAFSALKVDGERAYHRARAGEAVELATRDVSIFVLRPCLPPSRPCTTPSPETQELGSITLSAVVSKGTYIRSLARDIAHALGTVGHVSMLRRTKAGPFGIESAISLDILHEAAKGGALEALMRPIEAALDGIPALNLTPDQAAALRQGRVLDGQAAIDGLHLARLGDTPVALVRAEAGLVRVERGFNL